MPTSLTPSSTVNTSSQVLMLSSSKQGNEAYLEHARPYIDAHIGNRTEVVFIPYAGVTLDWDQYVNKVQAALPRLNIQGIHRCADPHLALQQAQAIFVGGGNTFNLLNELYQQDLIKPLQQQVQAGTPYVGWSAGSNICGLSIRTTNDMPIVEPPSFAALGIVPCQLNPHYTDYQPPNHNGETRDDRLFEFTQVAPTTSVLGIQEGTALQLSAGKLTLLGQLPGYHFYANNKVAINAGEDLLPLLKHPSDN